MSIRVAMIARSTMDTVPGGDVVQIRETARCLGELGIEAVVISAAEKPVYKTFDLFHFFNITRPADILPHVKRINCPYVVTPICIDYAAYDQVSRKGIAGIILKTLPAPRMEYFKTVARGIKDKKSFPSFEYLLTGQGNSIRKILHHASGILPNQPSEARRLQASYHFNVPINVIPNGIDHSLFQENTGMTRDPNLIICVARIEGLKNQLNLIRAVNSSPYRLLLIGNAAPNHTIYAARCRKEAHDNIRFIPHVSQHELLDYYAHAAVHVLPSFFETTGLSSLEAAAMGCKVVITHKGDAEAYFGNAAYYCDPADPQSIREAIDLAVSSPADPALPGNIRKAYSWQQAALSTAAVYHKILAR